MARRIAVIQGHPDASQSHFGHALAEAYASGAAGAGHATCLIEVARLDFPLLPNKHVWEHGETPPAITTAQQAIAWADHLVVFLSALARQHARHPQGIL
jgi:putative NADPH-quinone reductase